MNTAYIRIITLKLLKNKRYKVFYEQIFVVNF